MKFELKTDNDYFSKPIFPFLIIFLIISMLIIISNISLKIGNISRHHDINHLCRILIVDKSTKNFKRLSNLTNLNSKQKIWDFCRDVINI